MELHTSPTFLSPSYSMFNGSKSTLQQAVSFSLTIYVCEASNGILRDYFSGLKTTANVCFTATETETIPTLNL